MNLFQSQSLSLLETKSKMCLVGNFPHPAPETINRVSEYLPELGNRERK